MSSRLTQYLIPIMNDRVARLELRKNVKFQDIEPELYQEYLEALKSDDLMVMGAFLDKLDAKYSDVLYIKNPI